MRSEHSWSLLDPKPCLLYIPKCDDYIVYWNGIVMPHKMALSMAMEYSSGIYPSPEMKTVMEKNYEMLYYSNAFDTRAWDSQVDGGLLYPYIKRLMHDHLKKILEGKDAKEVLGWFDYTRARSLA